MIKLTRISKTYHHGRHAIHALRDINLSVNTGEIVGVIGKSGAGKSTLIRCVNLLERPSIGQVYIAGQDLTQLSGNYLRLARREIGMIFQHFNLLNSCTVYDNVALPLSLNKESSAVIDSRVTSLLELTGLTEKKFAYPSQLSGGQKQRVAIARALATNPKVLLCDEATSALDPQTTSSILNLLKDINKQLNLTILLITHEMEVVKQICDRVVVLDNGEIVEQGSVIDIFTLPQMPITQCFVQSSLKTDLPELLKMNITHTAQENSVPIWRIYFRGRAAGEPIVSYLTREIGLELNIIQANIECIQEFTIGILVGTIENKGADLESGLSYLRNKGLEVEHIGYVNRNVI